MVWLSRSGLRLDEVAVGKFRPAFLAAADAEDGFDARVEGVQLGQIDRPVHARAFEIAGLEFEIAQAEGLARPEERTPAHQAHAHPVIGIGGIVGVGDLFFIHPLVGVVFVGLIDVRQAPGLAEAVERQIVDRLC